VAKEADRMPPTDADPRSQDPLPARPKPEEVKGNPPKPGELDLTPARYAQLTPADKVAYHQAKLAYAQAYAQYDAAERAAHGTFAKPYDNFIAARQVYSDADTAVQNAIDAAQAQLEMIGTLSAQLKPNEMVKPEQAKAQVDRLAAATDEYKKAGDAIAAAVAARDKADAALAPLTEPGRRDRPNRAAQDLAADQYALELAQAQVILETAYDTYMVKKAEIIGHLPHSAKAA
jgi:hypothetical protein